MTPMIYLIPQKYIEMESAVEQARKAIKEADAILVGASNGLSIAEGYNMFANNAMFKA